jgi:hypothetical protein
MKYSLLLLTVLFGLNSFSQTSPIDFEPDGNGADFGWAVFEIPEGESIDLTIEANPVTDGINTSATAAKMDISYSTEATWGQAGTETDNPGMEMGLWSFNETNALVTVQVYQEGFASPVAIKFANPTFGAELETVVQNTVADEWVELTFDMSPLIGSGLAPFSQFIFFPSYGPRETGHVVWFDNVTFGSLPPAPGDPDVAAPDPTIDEANVISVYSETYMTNTVTNFNFVAFNGGVQISQVDIEGDGNLAGKLENLDFYGAGWDAVDLNDFEFVHLDYWSTTSTAFNFYLIDQTSAIPGGNPAEPRYSFGPAGDEPVVQGEWVSVTIPLQHFLDYDAGEFEYDLNDIFQYKFDGNGTIFFDNIYFSFNPMSVSNEEVAGINAFPNPSTEVWNVTSDYASIVEVRVFNILGQVVESLSPNSNQAQINASALEDGIYIAEIRTSQGTRTIKLIKE